MLEKESVLLHFKWETEHSKEASKTMQTESMTTHMSFSDDDHMWYLNATSFNRPQEKKYGFFINLLTNLVVLTQPQEKLSH
jgi:hypothetical protein